MAFRVGHAKVVLCVVTSTIIRLIFSLFESSLNIVNPEVYENAQKEWEAEFSPLAKWGWGPSVQAEKWNGRHAMFGWFFLCATAYAKAHGLIPNAEAALDLKEWGTLATISGANTITNERALILIANAHFFGVSLMATICPPAFGDSLLLDPNHPEYDRMVARNKAPFGYLPALKFGLTEEAEILNGRLAMVGIIALITSTAIFNMSMLDVINSWLGGLYTK